MIPIGFGPQVCGDLVMGTTREWLLTDGLGGYAMGTVSGLRTRRYHALLVVAGDVPASRHVGLVSLDPVVTLPSGAHVRLATHEWASGAIEPKGHHLIERFDLADGLPRWRWRIGDVVIEREIAMAHGRPAVAVVHRLIAGSGVRLALEALCTWRDQHGERYADGPPPRVIPTVDGAVVEQAYRMAGPGWAPTGQWWRGAHHREEAARGLASEEDIWYAGRFGGALDAPGDTLEVLAWAGDLEDRPAPATEVVAAARERHWQVIAAAKPADPVDATLALAADAFVVRTGAGPDVVAGYPWFGAWSRDTMTSYEGLFLATGRAEEGRELLRSYAGTLSRGMLANTADTGSVEYNTSDATMWFLHAVDRHVTVTGDTDLAAELLPALRGIVDAHLEGTRYGIRADPADGLIAQGAPGEALTWMDARVYGVPVTPRAGKPVEVNALWVNGLAAIVDLAARVGQDPGAAPAAHALALSAYRERYPAPTGWLYDVLDGPGGNDMSLRPNQLLAWSLPRAPMPEPDHAALRAIGAALMTPLGPRSLAPDSPGYTGSHRGTPAQRDAAYHQGTVWPWTIGPYADAARKAGWRISELFTGIESHLPEFGLASVSETADGYAPHAATGCPFQGWSVAEALRARRF
ncbi:amylo-alpha-1,6-glucosidase [Phytohabitans sp. LJ34]|uniref:amylo-alpha-1,6-glucosidase n=1 Tax=Phytohabitans sp. LJ34 TaxID=3452217 RepID=UPI003F8B8F6F